MNKKYFMPFLAISPLILIFGFLRWVSGEDNWICNEGVWVKHGYPYKSSPQTPCSSENIKVSNILINQEVALPFTLEGESRVFENQFNYKIKDSSGKVIKEGLVVSKSTEAGRWGKFEIKIGGFKTQETSIIVELFDYSAKDGSETDKIVIPLKIRSS